MKILHSLLRWSGLYILFILMVTACIWQEGLPVISLDHTLLLIGILVLFVILVNLWLNLHETNYLVSQSETRKWNNETGQFEPLEGKETRSEKTK
jgi:hypothetical protein